jgi:hypothetical protein
MSDTDPIVVESPEPAALRSDGWEVRPPLVPGGPTSPVTLLFDHAGMTQLVGEPPTAWQIPWAQMSHVHFVRHRRGMALLATIAGTRYRWSRPRSEQFRAIAAYLKGGEVNAITKRRRIAPAIIAVLVVLAATSTVIVTSVHTAPSVNEKAAATLANITGRDLPSSFNVVSGSLLVDLVGKPGQVFTNQTTTTAPGKNTAWYAITHTFQKCLGVSNATDRMYGAAGQMPDYEVTGTVFQSHDNGGVEVVSTAQYYATTNMVTRDTAEMQRSNFGSCFVTSQAGLLDAALGVTMPTKDIGSTWKPLTFAKGFAIGGVAPVSALGVTLQLAVAVVTHGHYEITVAALCTNFQKAASLLNATINTVKIREGATTAQVGVAA